MPSRADTPANGSEPLSIADLGGLWHGPANAKRGRRRFVAAMIA